MHLGSFGQSSLPTEQEIYTEKEFSELLPLLNFARFFGHLPMLNLMLPKFVV